MSEIFERLRSELSDRYAVAREIGSGGMATVYLAEDLKHQREVAVKVLRPELASSIGKDRFLLEIKIASQLQHPHILPLYDSGTAGDLLYYVMPFVEGETLADRLAREVQLPLADALRVTSEVAGALGYAHARGLVHRDIKPANIMLTAGHAVVTDFGIARAIEVAGGKQLTSAGMAVGTPAYMSPEQGTGAEAVDGRSDVYALGCVLYEMLTGEPPFTAPTATALIARHLSEAPRSIRTVRDTVPEHVETAILRALSKLPADRFQTAGGFGEALRTGATRPVAARLAPNRWVRRATFLVPLLLLVVALALWLPARFGGRPGVAAEPARITVLSFENLGSPDDEYFADGLTEEITSRLAKIRGLRVTSRRGAKSYKGSDASLLEIGTALQVDYVLDGTVRTATSTDGVGQVRVTPQLMHVSDDTQLWTNVYNASLTPGEVFDVQAQIAEAVARALDVTLLEPERRAVQAVRTEDAEAYQLYWQGRHVLERRDAQSLNQARRLFEQAIVQDSMYAEAYAGLADALSLQAFYQLEPEPAAWAEAETAARRSVALDPESAAAHTALGLTLTYGRWDWDGGLAAYDRAIALDPDYAVAWFLSAEIFMARRQTEDALTRARGAVDSDPQSAVAVYLLGVTTQAAGRTDEAIRLFGRTAELQPTLFQPHWNLLFLHGQAGRVDEARVAARNALARMTPDTPIRDEDVEVVVRAARGSAPADVVSRAGQVVYGAGMKSFGPVVVFTYAGQVDSAFAWLDAAVDRRNTWIAGLDLLD
ncbi:MAG: protein kinase, partial [Gemmatimonadales bacterium]|nr:protein kinase [Gemmatimonadales bacterium]